MPRYCSRCWPAAWVPAEAAGPIRFGRPENHFFEEVDSAILARIDRLIAALAEAGHAVLPKRIEGVERCLAIHVQTITAESAEAYWLPVIENPEVLGEDVRVRLEAGQFLASVDYVKAQRMRTAQRAALQTALADIDVLIMPTVATVAPEIGANEVTIDGAKRPLHPALTRFTTPFNQSGLPAITLPCGQNADGLPVGVQLASRYGNDARLLQVAAEVERIIPTLD